MPFVDWKAKVELFEQLRREHEFGVGTITGVAAKSAFTGASCAARSPAPCRRSSTTRAKPKLGARSFD